jgi:xylan 1,4-beta-xylosidase
MRVCVDAGRRWRCPSLILACLLFQGGAASAQSSGQSVVIDAAAPVQPFPHYWEEVIGSGRAALALRASYLSNLKAVKAVSGIGYVRFHAMFHDELGVYTESKDGTPIYNFQYLDQIYDGLLASGVRPFVELSFMPDALAARQIFQVFWYHPNISPPKSYAKWDALITEYARHIVARYGIDEVSQWYFEVWNEPNLDFWKGTPAKDSYFELYDHTARALKAVSGRLKVGGPSTAQLAWIGDFIAHTASAHVPVDFVSSHVYGDDPVDHVLGRGASVPAYGLVCPALRKAHDEISHSARPDLPLIISEFNASWRIDNPLLRSVALGPWLADTITRCSGLAQAMSYWTFSDDFEEGGVLREPLSRGFGLVGLDRIPKPIFAAYGLLHRLGDQRLAAAARHVLATRRSNGSLVVAAWNWIDPQSPHKTSEIEFAFQNLGPGAKARITRFDEDHGNTTRLYEQMGSPLYPSQAQVKRLQKGAVLSPEPPVKLPAGHLRLLLPPNGMALIEISR